jgi:predicted RNase H-like HicB family nuclease
VTHYLAIFVETDMGEWRVVFPDVPGCEARGFTLDDAQFAATSALERCIEERGLSAPLPKDLSAVSRSEEWLSRNHIDLSRAVITMVRLAA